MKFSVLLSLYHKESPMFLRESLNSIFSQTLLPDEVVLVEDGALTTELYQVVDEFVNRYSILKIVALKRNVGFGNALNEGLKYCSYDIVARMDTDDICKPERFATQMEFMESHPDIDVVGAWIDEFQEDASCVTSIRKVPQMLQEIKKFAKKRNPINHPSVMFRKQAVLAVGGYLPFYLFEDYYLWVRMLINGATIYNIPQTLLFFRFSSETLKRRAGLKYIYMEILFQWNLYKLGYINPIEAIENIGARLTVRVLPNGIRGWIYKKYLRK